MQNKETFELSFNHKRDKTGRQFSLWDEQVIKGGGPGFESDLRLRLLSVHYLQLCFLTKAIFCGGSFCVEKK